MIKRIVFTALALTAAFSASAQMMMAPDAKTTKKKELMAFIEKDAYKKLDAPDAYILTKFIGELPGNYQSALLIGLVRIADEADETKMKNQTAANAMAPMGDAEPMMDSSFRQGHAGERSFEMISMDPMARLSYLDTLKLLEIGQDETDRGLIDSLFTNKLFTQDPLMSPWNERQLDSIERYIKALAMSTTPVRLKYTSLAPHMYAGLPSDWANHPWPAGS